MASPNGIALRTARGIGDFAIGAAWFFIVVSLLHLVWVVGTKWGSPAGLVTLYQTSVGDHVYRAWGLSYEGGWGLFQAIGQILMVVTAAMLSMLPWLRARRVGHVVLVIWAAWWAMSLAGLAMRDHQLDTTAQTALLAVLLGCTGYRAWRGWWARGSSEGALSVVPPSKDEVPGTPAARLDGTIRAARDAAASASRAIRGAADHPVTRRAGAAMRDGAKRTITWLRAHGVVPESGAS